MYDLTLPRSFQRNPRRVMLGIAVSLAILWKLIATDWIVRTDYEYMGNFEVRTYSPPPRPIFSPPKPGDKVGGATSWRDMEYFYIGGAGGPIGEPRLQINWILLLIKLAVATGGLYSLMAIPHSFHRRYASPRRPRQRPMNR